MKAHLNYVQKNPSSKLSENSEPFEELSNVKDRLINNYFYKPEAAPLLWAL